MSAAPDAHVAALEVFADVLSQSDAADGSDEFYGRLCEAICRLAGMERAVLFRYDGARHGVRAAGAHGLDPSMFAGERFGVESAAIARRALAEDRVVEAFGPDVVRELPARYVELLGLHRVICTPMAAAGRWVGVIVSDRGPDAPPLDDADRGLLWTLGKTAALAAVARIATSQRERAAQLEQRLDLAREIHDGVIQRLFGVSLALSAADQDLAADARARCAAEVGQALGDLRAMLQRPLGRRPRATGTTLAAELARHAADHPAVEIAVDEGDPAAVPDRLEPLAQSVLGEAVRNAAKHAAPSRIDVRLRRAEGAFVLEVVNDGVRSRGRRPTGMGLRLVALEALQSGGVVEFGPRPGGRWQVRLVVPDDAA
ncbi:MAG TPA: GAF domain-containing protein [Capillimicrobium sp.]|nr:GAF domain-containing protein [Capillimicrobium sp.]